MYLEFSEVQLTKLKHLTLVSLAAKDKVQIHFNRNLI